MTGPDFDTEDNENTETRPISVAELLAKNGNIGSPPVTGRRRRRRGNSDAVTVAELTGEIPVIPDEPDESPSQPASETQEPGGAERGGQDSAPVADDVTEAAEPAAPDLPGDDAPGAPDDDAPGGAADDAPGEAAEPAAPDLPGDDAPGDDGSNGSQSPLNWFASGPRFPKSPPQRPAGPEPKRSPYPRPMPRRRIERSDAEQMSPDPAASYADVEVDVMDTDVRDAGFGDNFAELDAELARLEQNTNRTKHKDKTGWLDDDDDTGALAPTWADSGVARGALVVVQSIVAVALGAGLFLAFDQLWQWNNIVALVLSVLVTLGLVAAVQVVRKTPDTASTLIAVAVGLLITLGPLALLRSV
jgi:hypothetical protein